MSDTLSTRIAFSDEQAMLLEAATGFCRDHSPSSAVRARMGTADGFDPAHWQTMADMGWLGIAVPEAQGGSGLGIAACAVLAEPLGRHLLHTPFVATQLAIQGLLAGGSAAQQADWLPRLTTGAVGTVALFEDDGDWDLAALQSQAQSLSLGQILNWLRAAVDLQQAIRDGQPPRIAALRDRIQQQICAIGIAEAAAEHRAQVGQRL